MSKPKSSLLRNIIKRYQQASFIEKNPEFDTDTILELERTDPYTRRKFIKDSAKALTIIGLSSVIPFSACKSKPDSGLTNGQNGKQDKNGPVIAIIGGGIAGLNCAYQLQKKNFIATVYEADKRTGGRIVSKENALGQGLVTEYGGEFIDTNHQDMLDLVKEFGLQMYDTHADVKDNHLIKDAYYFEDKKWSEKEVINEFRKVAKKIESDKLSCGANYDTPAAKKLDYISLEEYVKGLPCNDWFKELLDYAFLAEFGLETSLQSSLNLIDMISTDTSKGFAVFGDSDERYKIVGGNAKVTAALYEKVKDQVQMGMTLTSIKNSEDKYELSFEGGKTVKADFVVMTIPFTMLRNVNIQLENMSIDKLKCINELGYGQNNKLILGTNSRPWRNTKHSGYLFNPYIHNGWDSSQMQNDNKGPGSYTIFLGGKDAQRIARSANDHNLKDEVPDNFIKEYLPILDKVFKGTEKSFSGTHKAAIWTNNPFIRASYASYFLGQWTTISGKEMEPISHVYFAGEHCSADFQGFMNGGAETGRRVAEGILKKMSVPM